MGTYINGFNNLNINQSGLYNIDFKITTNVISGILKTPSNNPI